MTNTAYTPAANGYFGIATIHSSAADPRATVELDQVYFTLPTSPSVTAVPNALAFGTVALTDTSSAMSYTVSGSNLTAGIVITAPTTDFRVSTTSGSGYTNTLAAPSRAARWRQRPSTSSSSPPARYQDRQHHRRQHRRHHPECGGQRHRVADHGRGRTVQLRGGEMVGSYSAEQPFVVYGRN